jgi:hypothetical protein
MKAFTFVPLLLKVRRHTAEVASSVIELVGWINVVDRRIPTRHIGWIHESMTALLERL